MSRQTYILKLEFPRARIILRVLCSHCSVVLQHSTAQLLLWLDNPFLHWAWACAVVSVHASRVGVVDKPQAYWTENAWFIKLFSAIQSVWKPFFHQYLPIGCAYSKHRCLELEIWRFLYQRRQLITMIDRQTNCFTPCACARGNYRNYKINREKVSGPW